MRMMNVLTLFLLISCCCGISFAQDSDVQKGNWLLGVKFKLENLQATAMDNIKKCEDEIRKCDSVISKSENIVRLAQQQENAKAEGIAREALNKARASREKNMELKKTAELHKKKAEVAMAYVNSGGKKDLEARLEQIEFETSLAAWKENQRQLIAQRLREPNQYAEAVYKSLKTKAPPPLPSEKFDELEPGDVLLIKPDLVGSAINTVDKDLSWNFASNASHTVLYLKTVNGKKLFLENIPAEGPRIITEEEFEKRYRPRGADVAKLAKPLNEDQGKLLWEEAVKMQAKNNRKLTSNWLNKDWFGSNYGVWGEDNLVCSESDWEILRAAGRNIPESDDRIKKHLGVKFSPADFYNNGQFFIVSSLFPPAKPSDGK